MQWPELKVKKIHPNAVVPRYMTEGSVGFDFYSATEFQLEVGGRTMARTGLAFEIPDGYELQVRARSGMSRKFPNYFSIGVGTIDQDYRGEILIPIFNHDPFNHIIVKVGDRIAQGIISPIARPKIVVVSKLSTTERGEGGFGHTGK